MRHRWVFIERSRRFWMVVQGEKKRKKVNKVRHLSERSHNNSPLNLWPLYHWILVFHSITILLTLSSQEPSSSWQIESILRRTSDSPESPRTPGISPTPLSPRITLTPIAQVLSPSTWSISSDYSELSDLVVAHQLKSSRTFNSNVTGLLTRPSYNKTSDKVINILG